MFAHQLHPPLVLLLQGFTTQMIKIYSGGQPITITVVAVVITVVHLLTPTIKYPQFPLSVLNMLNVERFVTSIASGVNTLGIKPGHS